MTGAHVHIDRVVVHGLPGTRGHEAALEGAVVAELTRLLRAEGVPAGLADASTGRLLAPTVRIPAAGGVGTLGAEVARAVYRSLADPSAPGGSRATVPPSATPTPPR